LKPAAGDIITEQRPEGTWAVVKILLIDAWPEGDVAHCLMYLDTAEKPRVETIDALQPKVMHAPIDAASFGAWERIANRPPNDEEFSGFRIFLKMTDFARYLKFTHQDAEEVIGRANGHYDRGNALGDQGKCREAIAEYDAAADLFPLFYEAMDNRALTYMELGEYESARMSFEESLEVEPEGETAFFGRAECHLRLDEFEIAERQFAEGMARFPQKRELFEQHRDMARKRINPAKQR
jgi:tetratricopeptide (TPR) repeat protein